MSGRSANHGSHHLEFSFVIGLMKCLLVVITIQWQFNFNDPSTCFFALADSAFTGYFNKRYPFLLPDVAAHITTNLQSRIRNDEDRQQEEKIMKLPTTKTLNLDDSNCDDEECTISPIEILYESEQVIAINKPPHIQHHDDSDGMGILSYIRHIQSSPSNSIEHKFPYEGRLYGVHRLDRVTSGILLLAKTRRAAQSLTRAFREKKVKKYYVALSSKKPKKKKQGWVKGDMAKGRRGAWKLQKTLKDPAITRFYSAGLGDLTPVHMTGVGNEGDSEKVDGGYKNLPKTLILFQPHTGKTHQLRVAAKRVGLPILGDPNYGDGEQGYTERTYLHAAALHVDLGEEKISIWSPPTDFGSFWKDNECEVSMDGNFGEILLELVKKHCRCDPILELIH